MDGEADMWASVVRLALADACGAAATSSRNAGGNATPRDAVEAWKFCTDTTGAWAESRALICGLCGVNPDILRDEAIRRGPGRGARAEMARIAEARAKKAKRDAARFASESVSDQVSSHRPATMPEASR